MIIDTNILVDLLAGEPAVSAAYADLAARGRPSINAVILAEFAVRFATVEDMEAQMTMLGVHLAPLDSAICLRAGAAFRDYRRRGGPRTTILPDFLIGAHAAVRGWPLLTRDRRFESYFPEVELIDPYEVTS